ncbi:tRNA lysidine(34) synthetase TilS [Nocardia sp. NPDC052001]|uniref:tRNA lysidine(34) synthetase TilS n=1 Tax=Nocardia sp. NPDC052001 TaxID=3154853 RepID=UPI00341F8B4E
MRHAVRDWLGTYAPDGVVAVGLSGGADSLALTAAAAVEADVVDAYVVDHGLQDGSAEVAAGAAAVALDLGCRSARVLTVEVGTEGGLEAAARSARYAALGEARLFDARPGVPVLLGHTLDDQAETVLLGLARGSGGRSIQGMTEYAEPWGRPLLGVRRAVTRQLCADLGLEPWEDPHNSSPEFTRVRLRTEVLPLLEEVLGGGVAPALARTAAQLREDGTALDAIAKELLKSEIDGDGLRLETLATVAPALRRRVIRAWLLAGGAKSLTDSNLRAVEALITDWRGQGGVAVGGSVTGTRLVAARERGRLILGSAHSGPDRGRHHL